MLERIVEPFNRFAALMGEEDDHDIACNCVTQPLDALTYNTAIGGKAEVMAVSRGEAKEAASVITLIRARQSPCGPRLGCRTGMKSARSAHGGPLWPPLVKR